MFAGQVPVVSAAQAAVIRDQYLFREQRWLSPLVHLAGGVLVCIALPYLGVAATLTQGWQDDQARNTALAALTALALGFWLHHNVGQLPGTRESSGILPAYTLSFGATLTIILIARISYSRAILILSFVAALGWFFTLYLVTQRQRKLTLGIVAGGHVDAFAALAGIRLVELTLDKWPDTIDAVTADFRVDHSDAWQGRLADFVLAGIPVYHSKDLHESLTGRAALEHLSENTFGALGPQTSLLFAKMLLDRAMALPALILLMPVLLAVGLAVRLDSRGPALFRQARVGYRGRTFTLFKFRTMFDESEQTHAPQLVPLMTSPDDPRITRLGRFLRRSRLDELPQIINVLRGEMSWIGPRPEALELSQWYTREIPYYRYRHVVRPGISGWAQVSQGHVSDVDEVRTKLQFDFYYIRNFSVWLDILIVAKTIKTILTGFGAR